MAGQDSCKGHPDYCSISMKQQFVKVHVPLFVYYSTYRLGILIVLYSIYIINYIIQFKIVQLKNVE